MELEQKKPLLLTLFLLHVERSSPTFQTSIGSPWSQVHGQTGSKSKEISQRGKVELQFEFFQYNALLMGFSGQNELNIA